MKSLIAPQDRLGLNREEAANYIGVSTTTFDKMIADGLMPQPKKYRSRRIWSKPLVERAFASLPEEGQDHPGDDPWSSSNVA